MSDRFIPRTISFAMAATVTWSMLVGIDTLAITQHAAHDLMAWAVNVVTALA